MSYCGCNNACGHGDRTAPREKEPHQTFTLPVTQWGDGEGKELASIEVSLEIMTLMDKVILDNQRMKEITQKMGFKYTAEDVDLHWMDRYLPEEDQLGDKDKAPLTGWDLLRSLPDGRCLLFVARWRVCFYDGAGHTGGLILDASASPQDKLPPLIASCCGFCRINPTWVLVGPSPCYEVDLTRRHLAYAEHDAKW